MCLAQFWFDWYAHTLDPSGSDDPRRTWMSALTLLMLLASAEIRAQIVVDPNSIPIAGPGRTSVINTAGGIPQVDITAPSPGGVSDNRFAEFNVPGSGIVLNNSPTIARTQLAGYVNGNPNLDAGHVATVIVNQVTGDRPSKLEGFLEVAGASAEVVIANPNGIEARGAGWINTTSAQLAAGSPIVESDGQLRGFRVSGASIDVQGSGIHGSDPGRLDLISRSVSIDAPIDGRVVRIVAGADEVDRLKSDPVSATGARDPPYDAIAIGSEGRVFADRIEMTAAGSGAGIANAGIVTAQHGGLLIKADGPASLSGKLAAIGAIEVSVRGSIDQRGSIHTKGTAQIVAGGNLNQTHTGTMAAGGNLLIRADHIATDGTLAAGAGADGALGTAGVLDVMSVHSLRMTGTNVAASDLSLSGAGISLRGSETISGGDLRIVATAGDPDLSDALMTASRDAAVTVAGRYVHEPSTHLRANRDIRLDISGTLVNRGELAAVRGLTVRADSVDNQSGAVVSAAQATLDISRSLSNAGRIEGEAVAIRSRSISNAATIVGRDITLSADVIANTGRAASLAAASRIDAFARERFVNTDGARVFSPGDIRLAADEATDAAGWLVHRTPAVINRESTIEARGNLEIAATSLSNTREAPAVVREAVDTSTTRLSKRGRYVACATSNPVGPLCSPAIWRAGYRTPVTGTYPAAQIVSVASGPRATDNVAVVRVGNQDAAIFYNALTRGEDGSITITHWDAYDPHLHYEPSTEYPTRSDAHRGYQRVEIARQVTTHTEQDRVVRERPASKLLAGNELRMTHVGSIDNAFSAIAAGHAIRMGDAAPSTTITNTGRTLYRYQTQNIVSTYAWNIDITRDVGNVAQMPVVLAPVPIGDTGGSIVAGSRIEADAARVVNTNLAAGLSASGASGATMFSGTHGQTVLPLIPLPRDVRQSMLDAQGRLMVVVPPEGLYTWQPARESPYRIETDPRLTRYSAFVSSDYMLAQLGLDPHAVTRRIGDGLYETQLVQDQLLALTGGVALPGSIAGDRSYRELMENGVRVARQIGLRPGVGLSLAQVEGLTTDMVWLVRQRVASPDGVPEDLLVPVVYLSRERFDREGTATGAHGSLIAAEDVHIRAAGEIANSGTIRGGARAALSADAIVNRAGAIGSDRSHGSTVIQSRSDVVNESARISGHDVVVTAERDVINTTLIDDAGVQLLEANSEARTGLAGARGLVGATGELAIRAGRDLRVDGADISGGLGVHAVAGRDLIVDAKQVASAQSVTKSGQHRWEERATRSIGGVIASSGDLSLNAGRDLTFRGARIAADASLIVSAGRNLTATTRNDSVYFDGMATEDETRTEISHRSDETATGTTFAAGGALVMGAANDLVFDTGRERHESDTVVGVRHVGALGRTTTRTHEIAHSDTGVGSTVSADSVQISAGRDLIARGAAIAGSHDVELVAGRDAAISAATHVRSRDIEVQRREAGIFAGNAAILGVPTAIVAGVRSTSDRLHDQATDHTPGLIGSLEGDLDIRAGRALSIEGSRLHAGRDLALTGARVSVASVDDQLKRDETHAFRQAGVSAGVASPAIAAPQGMADLAQQAKAVRGDTRLQTLAAATAGLGAYRAYETIAADPAHAGGFDVEIKLGSTRDEVRNDLVVSTPERSVLEAGRDLRLTARGGAAEPIVEIKGSGLVATRDVDIASRGDIRIDGASSASRSVGSRRASDISAGIGYGFGAGRAGFSIPVSVAGVGAHDSHGQTSWVPSEAVAGHALRLASAGDVSVSAAHLSAHEVRADVGRNLSVRSLQDTRTDRSDQWNAGVSLRLCVPPLCVGATSVSAHAGHRRLTAGSDDAPVRTELVAGDGGFRIHVDGNADLEGAALVSSASAVREGINRLETGTLTYRNIDNRASIDGTRLAVQGGFRQPDEPEGSQGQGDSGYHGLTAGAPVTMHAADRATSTTPSAISGGAIVITDPQAQHALTGQTPEEVIAGIDRDTDRERPHLRALPGAARIDAGFAITGQLSDEAATFVQRRVAEAERLLALASVEGSSAGVDEQRDALGRRARDIQAVWGPGGTGRQVLMAMTLAAARNVSADSVAMAQAAFAGFLTQQGAEWIGRLVAAGALSEGSPQHAQWQALVACAGAAAGRGDCGSAALGAGAASLLTNLLTDTGPGETEASRQTKANLIDALVAGVASATGVRDAVAATQASASELDNNWLASSQIAARREAFEACKGDGTCLLVTTSKWMNVSLAQDRATASGVVKGLIESGISDIQAITAFLSHPDESINGLLAMVDDPELRRAVGSHVVDALRSRIRAIESDLRVGGIDNAEDLGKQVGSLIYQVASATSFALGATRASVRLASIGAELSTGTLSRMAAVSRADRGILQPLGAFERGERVERSVRLERFGPVPGRVQSRINVSRDGFEHVRARHLDPHVNASRFTIGEAEIRGLLARKDVVGATIRDIRATNDNLVYVREVDVGQVVGLDKFNAYAPTSVMTVITDSAGQLKSAFPGRLE